MRYHQAWYTDHNIDHKRGRKNVISFCFPSKFFELPEPLTAIFPACSRMLLLVATPLQFVAGQACPAEK
jgi:hypothetical protein